MMFRSRAKLEVKAQRWFSYMNGDWYQNDPMIELADIASTPDDFMLSSQSGWSAVKLTYLRLRGKNDAPENNVDDDYDGFNLNPVLAFLLAVMVIPVQIKMMRDQRLLRELAVIEIARRMRLAGIVPE